MQSEFYINTVEGTVGPFSIAFICEQIDSSSFNLEDYIFIEEKQEWQKIDTFNPVKKRLEVLNKLKSQFSHDQNIRSEKSDHEILNHETSENKISEKSLSTSEKKLLNHQNQDMTLQPQPHKIVIQSESVYKVGFQNKIKIVALDENDHLIENYNSEVTLNGSGTAVVTKQIKIQNGIGEAIIFNRTSELVIIKITDNKNSHLSSVCTIDFIPSSIKKLLITAPQESSPDQPIQVQIKAVDAFGNTVTDFKNSLSLHFESANGVSQISIKTA